MKQCPSLTNEVISSSSGGSSEVRKVRHKLTKNIRAVKIVNKNSPQAGLPERVTNEITSLKRLVRHLSSLRNWLYFTFLSFIKILSDYMNHMKMTLLAIL